MSDYFVTSPKPCSTKHINHRKLLKKLSLIFSVIFSVAMIIVLIWYTVHPSKPQFSLHEATISQVNLSTNPPLLSSAVRFVVIAKNPNQRTGIYYDKLEAYVAYRGEQITKHSSFPPFYQSHDDVNVLSSWLTGNSVLLPPSFFGDDKDTDRSARKIVLNLRFAGRVRWKYVGMWVSSGYNLEIQCDAFMAYTTNSFSGHPVSMVPGSQCHSTV